MIALAFGVLAGRAVVHAGNAPDNGAGVDWRPSEIKKPSDFAPPEQVVAGRNLQDIRREGTLLSKTTRDIPRVDAAGLAARKRALYAGERYHRSPLRDEAAAASPAVLGVPGRHIEAAEDEGPMRFGWLGWTLLGAIGAAALVAWRLGWFVPFSQRRRSSKRARTSIVASEPGRNPSARSRGPKVELVRRGG